MPSTYSPLRYPGGKTSLYAYVNSIIQHNRLFSCTYVEPFAGGAGLALKLLFKDNVERIVLNDLDAAIYSFWYCVLNHSDALCDKISSVRIDIDEWKRQKEIYAHRGNGNIVDFAFSVLFLNRTNVSGILKGGVIGGEKQEGPYPMNARFTVNTLISKIKKIHQYKSRIELHNHDAVDFIDQVLPRYQNTFVYFDPPYVKKGASLYINSFQENDHITLAGKISNYENHWIVTYDDCKLIRDLYAHYQFGLISINYSAGSKKKSKEILIASPTVVLPKSDNITFAANALNTV